MFGPYSLMPTMTVLLTPSRLGVYVWNKGTNWYVGRGILSDRLGYWSNVYQGGRYWFMEADSPYKAFYFECFFYHDCQKENLILLNKRHPEADPDTNWVCPFCPTN